MRLGRRVHLVPFDAEFSGSKEDKGLEEALKKEAPGIMSLMVQASLEWQAIGLAPPARVSQATRRLFEELDPIGRFAAECLVEGPEAFLTTDELSVAYATFLHENDSVDNSDHRTLVGRLKSLPGVKQVTRVGPDGVRRRGIVGRKLKVPEIDTRHT